MDLSVSGIPTSRVSDMYVQQRLLDQMQSDQTAMLNLETELSSGNQYTAASQNPIAAMQIMSFNSLLATNAQMTSNVTTDQSYLSTTDTALSNISNLLTQAQADATGVIGSTSTAEARGAAVQEITQTIDQLMNIGNQQYSNQYLFAGSDTAVTPFTATAGGDVQYNGNDQSLSSFSSVNQLFATNVSGAEAFGALSAPVVGANLDPVLSFSTPLSTLRQGAGISLGSIQISDGTGQPSIVNLSGAQTIGDVAAMIQDNAPAGRSLEVDVTATGLNIQLVPVAGQPSELSISDVGNGTTANELGIASASNTGSIQGAALNPTLTLTTPVSDILGVRATASVHSTTGSDADFIVSASTVGPTASDGTSLNGVTVSMVNDPSVTAGNETAVYTPGWPGSLVVHIQAGATTAAQVVTAINNATYDGESLPFQAQLNPLNSGTGQGVVDVNATAQTQGGSGMGLDLGSGLQIVNGGQTYTIDLSGCKTVQDVLNALNGSGAGVLAQINQSQNGIQVQSRISGSDFTIGENGGQTATQLGIRTLTSDTSLSSFDYGGGVQAYAGDPANGVPANDFTITRSDGSQFGVSVAGLTTVGQVIDAINNVGGSVQAELASYGNGIVLTDSDPGGGTIGVTANPMSSAAEELGLVPSGQTTNTSTSASTAASASISSGVPNSDLVIAAKFSGPGGDVPIIFNNTGVQEGSETADFSDGSLVIDIGNNTNANDVIAALQNNPTTNAAFSASLDLSNDPTNNGTGLVSAQTVSASGGSTAVLNGTDGNPQETAGVFNALLRLNNALTSNDTAEAQRDINQLSQATQNLSFTQAALGAREQGLTAIQTQLTSQNTQLQSSKSNVSDADLATVISELTSRQVAFQASLQVMGQMFKMTLLDYL
jgi:flagellar hook-associated protein 3